MNRRGFLGTLAASFAGAMMIRSLGQTELMVPDVVEVEAERQAVVVDSLLTGISAQYMTKFYASEDLFPGDLVELGPDGKARRYRGGHAPIIGVHPG